MNARLHAAVDAAGCRCPICGNSLPREAPLPRFDAPCSGCGGFVWCREQDSEQGIALEVLPDRIPEPTDLERLANALIERGGSERVIVDLTRLEMVSSAFVARLIALNKRLRGAGRSLELAGMTPVVREVFRTLHLDRAFSIRGNSENAA